MHATNNKQVNAQTHPCMHARAHALAHAHTYTHVRRTHSHARSLQCTNFERQSCPCQHWCFRTRQAGILYSQTQATNIDETLAGHTWMRHTRRRFCAIACTASSRCWDCAVCWLTACRCAGGRLLVVGQKRQCCAICQVIWSIPPRGIINLKSLKILTVP